MADSTNMTDEIGTCRGARPPRSSNGLAPKLLELLEPNFVYVTASGHRLRRDDVVIAM
jgi:hypothetical protein